MPDELPVINLSETTLADLGAHLLDLLHDLEGKNVPILLVGGFGLFLRQERVRLSDTPTLYEYIPPIRATDDFDIVLKLDILADLSRVQQLRDVLDALKYEPVPGAEKYQFYIPGTGSGTRRNVKIDLLARHPHPDYQQLKLKNRRVMTKRDGNPLHAHVTPEAVAIEDGPTPLVIEGQRTDGNTYRAEVLIPHPYALYLMKLFAFRDEEENRKNCPEAENEKYARKHVSDLYTLTATLTSLEEEELQTYRSRYETDPITQEAGQIVQEYFGNEVARGAIRLTETQGNLPTLTDFLQLLNEIFPVQPTIGNSPITE